MAFDPDAYLMQKTAQADFDPDAYLADRAEPEPKKYGTAETAIMQGLQGATGNFLDEISGAGEAAGRAVGVKGLGGSFGDVGFSDEGPTLDWETLRDAYRNARDKKRGVLKEQSEESPALSMGANLAGAVASPLNKLTGGLSLAGGGALLGGVNALGASESEDFPGMAQDTAIGAGVGGALGKAVDVASPYIQKGIEKVGGGAKDLAEKFAARALGAERGTIKKLGADKVMQAGRQALDEGVISPLASTEDMLARNSALKSKGGEMMGKAYQAIDDAGASTFNPLDAAANVEQELGGFYRSPINRGETNQLENTLESILMRGDADKVIPGTGNIPLRAAQDLKQELGKVANWKNNLNITDKEQMARDAYRIISDHIDDAVAKGSDAIEQAGLSEALNTGKSLYSNASASEQLLDNKLAREQGNKLLGITDWGLLGGGLGAAVPTGGASIPATMAMTAAKKGLERYGSQNAALGLDKISKALMKSPKMAELATNNPGVFNAFAQRMGTALEGRMGNAAENKSKPYDQNALIQKTQGTKYAQALQDAAQRGPQAFGATHFILQSRDPEYRQAIMDDEEQE